MRNQGFTLVELMVVIVVIGILVAIAIPNYSHMTSQSRDAGVKANSHTVMLAAEDFAVQNDGHYAADLSDLTPTGGSIIDALPQNQRLPNPFTKARTEPVDGAAANVGETGYEPVVDGGGNHIGYVITGVGHGARQVCRFSNGF